MISDQQRGYQEFEKELDEARKLGSNLLILTMPGLGTTHYARAYAEKRKGVKVVVVNQNEELDDFSILCLDFNNNSEALQTAESYFTKIGNNQKIVLVINDLTVIESKKYQESYLSTHFYRSYWAGVMNSEDVEVMAKGINSNLGKNEIEIIYQLSGGVASLVKYLAVIKDLGSYKLERLIKDDNLRRLLNSMLKAMLKTDIGKLAKLGLIEGDRFKSELLEWGRENRKLGRRWEIVVGAELKIKENGKESGYSLTAVEREIIERMLSQDGFISKEEISDIKWGEGKYEKYSDQAIKKTMQRIEGKLTQHQIEAVRGVGYIISKK
jgi:hypothetical protein